MPSQLGPTTPLATQFREQRDNPCSPFRREFALQYAIAGMKAGAKVGFLLGAGVGIPLAYLLTDRNFDWKNPAAYALITSVASLAGAAYVGLAGAAAGAVVGLCGRVKVLGVAPTGNTRGTSVEIAMRAVARPPN